MKMYGICCLSSKSYRMAKQVLGVLAHQCGEYEFMEEYFQLGRVYLLQEPAKKEPYIRNIYAPVVF